MFWVPEDTKLELRASPFAQIKTWLLTVIDENGIPFNLMVNEDKDEDSALLKFLGTKCQGAVFAADGAVRMPFLQGQPQGFRFFGISGSYNGDPQIFHVKEKYKKAIAALDQQKRRNRGR